MRCTPSGRALVAPALTSILLLAACADAPTSPAASHRPAPPRPLASLASYASGGALTLWDEYGAGYTLHPALSEIHATDGTVFELNASELADAMTAFVAAYEGDQASNALAAAPVPSEPGCGVLIDGCTPEYAYSVDGPVDSPMPDTGGVAPLPSSGGFIMRRSEADPASSPPGGDLDAAGLAYVASCIDIANAIYDATLRHRASRGAVLTVLKTAVSLNLAMEGYGIRIKLANFQGLGFKLETAAHEQLTRTTQLNILASLYSAYGCWSGSWGNADSVGSTYLYTPAPVYQHCRWELVDVSLDGGRSWAQRYVQICEYYMD